MIIKFCLIVLISLWLSQDAAKRSTDFSTLQKMSIEELKLKTQAHKEIWGLDKIERWDLKQSTGELVFSFADGTKAVCPAQIIGTYNSEDHTWLWSWANSSINENLKKVALKVRKFGQENEIERLTKSKWVSTEEDAWAMAALAVKLGEEQGAYRGPAGGTLVFISFGEVKLSKK